MSTAIVSAAVCTDTDTGSYFELATRAGRQALEAAEVSPERVGLVINAGVFRDSNIAEPAVAALIQKRLEVGLEYETGRVPAFSFDLLNGATGVVHALMTAQCFTGLGEVEYALIVAGDTHPSTERGRADFPYTAGGAAILLHASESAGGFGRIYAAETPGVKGPTAWADLEAAGTDGRNALTVRPEIGDPLALSESVLRECLAGEGLQTGDFATGAAVLLTPAPVPGFRERVAYHLGIPSAAVAGIDPFVGDPYSAGPVHAYLSAASQGMLDEAHTVVFLAADENSAACLVYRPRALVAAQAAP
ncbi:hypothetical protein GPX89_11170 [Nocardia sp. ET3-3]|uniref:Beta-ketoacyl-[acyl-carrier-protein] synthase III N-terminal domain-containing protein n=1 Tax=Nocardia terrae TaxID=2675851 RepID=A0A7K1UTW9_9NOCA|nr:hypothetical protein [Nocardia terrae]MVU77802.1 hypothetical protein [Nocardia terrae]